MKYYQLINFNSYQQQQSLNVLIAIIKKSKFKCIANKNTLLITNWLKNHNQFIQKNIDLIKNKYFKNQYFLIYSFILENTILFCQQCHKILCFKEVSKRALNKRFCSNVCSSSNKDVISKYKNTCLKRYNNTFAPISQQSINKRKNTCLQKYGVDNPAKNKHIIQKISNTCKISLNKKEIKNKKQQTYFNKYHCTFFYKIDKF